MHVLQLQQLRAQITTPVTAVDPSDLEAIRAKHESTSREIDERTSGLINSKLAFEAIEMREQMAATQRQLEEIHAKFVQQSEKAAPEY